MKKQILTTILLCTMSCWIYSQHVISGIIKDIDGEILIGANILEKGTANSTITDFDGSYSLTVQDSIHSIIIVAFTGYISSEIKVEGKHEINSILSYGHLLDEIVVTGYAPVKRLQNVTGSVAIVEYNSMNNSGSSTLQGRTSGVRIRGSNSISSNSITHIEYDTDNESYSAISSNKFKNVSSDPLSTFSIDVDRASYSNIRRFINNGILPPPDAVRIEEMINYFNYEYPNPSEEHPITIINEVAPCPWNKKNKLIHIGMKASDLLTEELPTSNLVFLLDVSGSMSSMNKLPLLKKSMVHLVNNLRSTDQVSIVVYAGSSGLVLPPTSGDQKDKIMAAMDKLDAGGSTAGGQGIKLAYKIAAENKEQFDNSRIILATDGDFNVGINSDGALQRLIEEKRKSGIYLTCLGFGMGNYKDSKLEVLADKGNGNYAYIDNINEAKKVLGEEFAGTVYTVAKDVKIQIEFNPKLVEKYKLIGYENRLLNNEDFEDDSVDAGEIGLGHSVTAIYEITPRKEKLNKGERRYVKQSVKHFGKKAKELAFIKVRYKNIDAKKSIEFHQAVKEVSSDQISNNVSFSSAVALFGLILREDKTATKRSYDDVLALASTSLASDDKGHKKEFIELVNSARNIQE